MYASVLTCLLICFTLGGGGDNTGSDHGFKIKSVCSSIRHPSINQRAWSMEKLGIKNLVKHILFMNWQVNENGNPLFKNGIDTVSK